MFFLILSNTNNNPLSLATFVLIISGIVFNALVG